MKVFPFIETVSETATPESEVVPSSGGGDTADSGGEDDYVEFNMEGRTKACNLLIGDDINYPPRICKFKM